MRLLKFDCQGELVLTRDLSDDELPAYAILSHTWGPDEDEIKLQELSHGPDKTKTGYRKLRLCGEQARRDNLDHFWVDTCCIDKTSSSELSKNINSMFRYYRNAQKCYVYLSDVGDTGSAHEFEGSRWFRRGWTLQELLAPQTVDFFSSEWKWIGDKKTLETKIHSITEIPIDVLRGGDLTRFSKDERLRWTSNRETREKEDQAYCLLGIFGVTMCLQYSEGQDAAFARLENKIRKKLKPTLQAIDSRIHNYYLSDGRLDIERLSGQRLPMEECYINLGITDRSRHSDHGTDIINQGDMELTMPSRINIDTPPSSQIRLEALYQPGERTPYLDGQPYRILIWGRAGMGKTTLCKKIVYDFLHNDLWQHAYDRIFWLPLRRLRLMPSEAKTVAEMVHEICFFGSTDHVLSIETIHDILIDAEARCLFVLDGLDEVSYAFDQDSPMSANLDKLLKQKHVIITSRPHSTSILKRLPPNLEVDTIGFSNEQVAEFLRRESVRGSTSPVTIEAIQAFIQDRPIVQSLVRIPIQLDAICYAWDEQYFQQDTVTMTMLYQAICDRLWQKDIVRLGKKYDGECITLQRIQDCTNIRQLVEPEISCLEELAFAGLYCKVIEFRPRNIDAVAGGQVPLLNSRLSKLSFLRSSENLLRPADRTTHFIHLTFQEFFAAHYFVRHWLFDKPMLFLDMTTVSGRLLKHARNVIPKHFVQKAKYNPSYAIFWRFVVGVLSELPDNQHLGRFFHELDSTPHDEFGTARQKLVTSCLNEVVNDQNRLVIKAQELEDECIEWFYTEKRCQGFMLYRSWEPFQDLERPDAILKRWMGGSVAEKSNAMKIIRHMQQVSSDLLDMVIEIAQNETDTNTRYNAVDIAISRCNQLPDGLLYNLLAREDKFGLSKALQQARFIPYKGPLAMDIIQALLHIDPILLTSVMNLLLDHEFTQPVMEILIETLQQEDSGDRTGPPWTAEKHGHPDSFLFIALARLLGNEDPAVRSAAAQYLRESWHLPDFILRPLVNALQDQDSSVQEVVFQTLSRRPNLPAFAVEAVILKQGNAVLRQKSGIPSYLQWSDRLPDVALQILVGYLRHQDRAAQVSAFKCLEQQCQLPEFVIEALVSVVRDISQHFDVWSSAAATLVRQRRLPDSAFELFGRHLQHRDPRKQCKDAEVLSRIFDLPDTIINVLLCILQNRDQDFKVRKAAAAAIAGQNNLQGSVLDTLICTVQEQGISIEVPRIYSSLPVLPTKHLEFLLRLLRSNPSYLAVSAMSELSHRAEFYRSFASLDHTTLVVVFQHWLSKGMRRTDHVCMTVHDTSMTIYQGGKEWTVDFKDDQEKSDFKQRWRDAQKAIGMPIRRDFHDTPSLKRKRSSSDEDQEEQTGVRGEN